MTGTEVDQSCLEDYHAQFSDMIAQSDSDALKRFIAARDALPVRERIVAGSDMKFLAGLKLFDADGSYSGLVAYDKSAVRTLEDWAVRHIHEMIHVMQFDRSAALHAIPANSDALFWLSPRDFMFSQIALEIDAYAKQGWLTNEFARISGCDLERDSYSLARDFAHAAEQTGHDTRKALAYMGVMQCFNGTMRSTVEGEGSVPFVFNYQRHAYDCYVSAIQRRIDEYGADYVQAMDYVRLTADDIIAMTDTLGVGSMINGKGELCEVYAPGDVHEDIKIAAHELGSHLQVAPRDELPTLEEGLARYGTTAPDIITATYGATYGPRAPEIG